MPKHPRNRPPNPNATLSALPPELLEQILLNLPAKALLTKYRLVCKHWKHLLTTSSVLKYYSTTSTYRPTTDRQIRWYQYLYDFNPLFIDVLYQLWKRLVPLWGRYREPAIDGDGFEVSKCERDRVDAMLAREIEVLYLRYLHVFSIIPMVHPVYRETRQRIIPINWGMSKSRADIILDQEQRQEEMVAMADKNENEKEISSDKKSESQQEDRFKEKEGKEGKEGLQQVEPDSKLHIRFTYPPKYTSSNPGENSNSKRLLIYLCRFTFMLKPTYINGSSSPSSSGPYQSAAPPVLIPTRINIKVHLAWANRNDGTEVEGRTLSLLSTSSYNGDRPIISKFDVDNAAITMFD
ncbi:hypothetical protein TWF506_000135 [Arthrobotrys conoides]|uniref:F-box domain-containing protein n=1 Tax=Arthrobotrys conoides TaxID=74498 RepID=A0AAN8RXB2_9PEZI